MAGPFRRTRHLIAYLVAKSFLIVVQIVPRSIMLRAASTFGSLLEMILVPTRREIIENLDHVFGDSKTYEEKRKICRGVFRNLGMAACDAIKVPSLPLDQFRQIVQPSSSSEQPFEEVKKRGAVIAAGHLSCFELVSHLFGIEGLPVVAIGAELFDARIDREVTALRTRNNILYLTRTGASRRLIKELQSKRVLASLIDQDATNDGVFARFLGHLAYTPTGPIRLSLRYDVPLYFFHLERQDDYSYRYHLEGPVAIPDAESDDEKRVILAQKFNDFIGAQIRKCPEQWVWMHRRWKRQRIYYPNTPSVTDYEVSK